jgi:hypothetical protein
MRLRDGCERLAVAADLPRLPFPFAYSLFYMVCGGESIAFLISLQMRTIS